MNKYVVEFLHEKIKEEEASDDNFIFLANIGKKRNWKQICAICLVEDIMGTTCGCGHTEIVIFKPCGHSLCVNPCFQQWITGIGVVLNPQVFKFGDKEFIIPSQSNVNLNYKEIGIFPKCPICRTNIDSSFRAEETYIKFNIDKLTETIYEELIKLI
jgi:hypothetical protein